MGSPISLLVANPFMEDFKSRVLSTSQTPRIWLRYMGIALLSKRQNTPNSSSLTLIPSTPYTVHSRGPKPKDPSCSWTHYFL